MQFGSPARGLRPPASPNGAMEPRRAPAGLEGCHLDFLGNYAALLESSGGP